MRFGQMSAHVLSDGRARFPPHPITAPLVGPAGSVPTRRHPWSSMPVQHVAPVAPTVLLALTLDQAHAVRSLLRQEATRIALLSHAGRAADRTSRAARFRDIASLEHDLADQTDAPHYWGMGALDDVAADILAGRRVTLG